MNRRKFINSAAAAGVAANASAAAASAMALVSYPSIAAVGEAWEKLGTDKAFQKAAGEYDSSAEPGYMRMESSLLRAFDGWPAITPPKPLDKGSHIFELRTYESNSVKASKRKIKMFNDAEAGIFKRLGMQPVFFGETIVGKNMPNLPYMVTFASLAEREKLWGDFGKDPEWQKLRAEPELSDAL